MRIILVLIVLLVPFSSAAAQQGATEAAAGGARSASHYPAGLRWDPSVNLSEAVYPAVALPGRAGPRDFGMNGAAPLYAANPGEGRRYSVTGGVIGAVVGAVAGGALACLANRDDYGVYCAGQSDTKVVIGAVLGAGVGAWIGAVVLGRRD